MRENELSELEFFLEDHWRLRFPGGIPPPNTTDYTMITEICNTVSQAEIRRIVALMRRYLDEDPDLPEAKADFIRRCVAPVVSLADDDPDAAIRWLRRIAAGLQQYLDVLR